MISIKKKRTARYFSVIRNFFCIRIFIKNILMKIDCKQELNVQFITSNN